MSEKSEKAQFELKGFTPRTIKEMEDRERVSLLQLATEESMANTFKLIQVGIAGSEDDAEKFMQDYFDNGGDIGTLQLDIVKYLENRGFLARKYGISEKMEARAEQVGRMTVQEMEDLGRSANNG